MNENLIKKKYKEKINSLNYYNKKYYDENISEISDSNYDILKKEIIELEKKYSFLKSKKSPQIQVGYKPSKNFRNCTVRRKFMSYGPSWCICNIAKSSLKFKIIYFVNYTIYIKI